MPNKLWLLALSTCVLTLSSCAPTVYTTADFERLKPRTVLVLPPENTTANTEVLQKSYPFLYSELAQRGYYAISPELTLQLFRANKLNDPGQINSLPTNKFNEVFGVDAVLKTRVTEWSSKYYFVTATVNVGFDMTLVDAKTGTTLWHREQVLSKNPGTNINPVSSIINAALTAIFTAYEPIASENAKLMLFTLPVGPYYVKP